jgi:CheY-like chemotaxis protein
MHPPAARILVIDDDADFRALVADLLTVSGHTVVEADDGQVGIACYRAQPFDLVLTDMIMPRREGIEVIRAIRRLNPRARIVAMSGGAAAAPRLYLQMAGHLGADRTLLKPFSAATLLATVADLLAAENAGPGPQ